MAAMLIDDDERPGHAALTEDLKLLREKGLVRLDQLPLPALLTAGRLITADQTAPDNVVIETVLRRAVERFGGGAYGESAAILYGLDQGTRSHNSRARRELAAAKLERSADTFRKRYEPTMLAEIATQILTLCTEQHSKRVRDQRERRAPAESAMAVEWLRRFEDYYRIWTPVSGVGNDLTAYRATVIESGRPYDRRFGTEGSEDEGYSQEEQAEGYARDALYHYARFEWELRQFVARSGGLWLLSDADAEQALSDAVYRIAFHTPWNERDQSYLRTIIAETPNHELHGFLERLAATELGRTTQQEWQEWVATCNCDWDITTTTDEHFPTSAKHKGIDARCEVHRAIAACGEYCELVDADWRNVADWYHLDAKITKGLRTERLYSEQLERRQASGWAKRSRRTSDA
jgi:hypothetical protein